MGGVCLQVRLVLFDLKKLFNFCWAEGLEKKRARGEGFVSYLAPLSMGFKLNAMLVDVPSRMVEMAI